MRLKGIYCFNLNNMELCLPIWSRIAQIVKMFSLRLCLRLWHWYSIAADRNS
jgi:hypothetical protein